MKKMSSNQNATKQSLTCLPTKNDDEKLLNKRTMPKKVMMFRATLHKTISSHRLATKDKPAVPSQDLAALSLCLSTNDQICKSPTTLVSLQRRKKNLNWAAKHLCARSKTTQRLKKRTSARAKLIVVNSLSRTTKLKLHP